MNEKTEIPRLDRTAFSMQSFEQATNRRAYWLSKPPKERLAAAWYLICCAYNLDYQAENQIDRTCFEMRKRT